MLNRFIDKYKVILLDMGNTFMFDCDRFGDEYDYYSTYRSLGGKELSSGEVTSLINLLHDRLMEDYWNPDFIEDFSTVPEYMRKIEVFRELPVLELELFEKLYAKHEIGFIPDSNKDVLHTLRKSHPLGLISNILSNSKFYEAEFEREGVLDLFKIRVWSSDHRCLKPSSRLFQLALDHFKVEPGLVVYAGDNTDRDLVGAKNVGMGAIWIENKRRPLLPEHPKPDLIVSDLSDLLKT